MTNRLPSAKVDASLAPAEVAEVERSLAAAIAEVPKPLEDAGEDPLGPLPSRLETP